jgi:transcriptional regulator with XRE-family HTH domain
MTYVIPRLRNERLKLALSQEDLAGRVGTTASNVSRWEHGITTPTPYFRRQLCELFQLMPEELFPEATDELSMLSSLEVFHFNADLKNAQDCFGHAREKTTLLARASKAEATSIVGPRRIGKTWLMKYLKLVAPSSPVVQMQVGFIDLTSPSCSTLAGFALEALRALDIHTQVDVETEASSLLALEQGVRAMQAKNLVPILCIDEFEGFRNIDAFSVMTLEHLRAIAQAGLGLVVASQHPLIEMVEASMRTSPFFNIFRQMILKPYTQQEAEDFARIKASEAGFSDAERASLLNYSREKERDAWFPLRMQLVGTLLLEDKLLAEQGHHTCYRPDEVDYWQEFEKRVEETYRGAVR